MATPKKGGKTAPKSKADAEDEEVEDESQEEEAEETDESEAEESEDEDESKDSDEEDEDAEDSEDDSSSTTDSDYEAIIQSETERADKAQRAAADTAFKQRKKKRETDEEEEGGEELDDSKPVTVGTLKRILSQGERQRESNALVAQALDIAKKHTTSDAEARAAVLYYRNRVVHTNDLEEDVLSAIAMLNRKRTPAKLKEIARANKGDKGKTHDPASARRNPQDIGGPKLSPNDHAAVKAAGMVWKPNRQRFEKAIGQNRVFCFDPKTKKRWTERKGA